MTPSLPDILMGQFLSLGTTMPPEAGPEYIAGRMGMLATLAILAAQEAERGPAARLWENREMRSLFAEAAAAYDQTLGDRLSEAARSEETAFEWSALDAANAHLRRLLIALHEAVEARGDEALDRRILALYRAMADHRRLDFPALGG